MNIIRTTHCAVNGKDDLAPLEAIITFPVFTGTTDQPREQDLLADMAFAIGKSSGSIQLLKLVPPDILYAERHAAGTQGKIWKSTIPYV